jgi:uncharacterized protein (DUF362 family)
VSARPELDPGVVAVYRTSMEPVYPDTPPYSPSESYPEYPFGASLSEAPNAAYDSVRESLALLGLDRENYGTPQWNPLGALVRPDDFVVVKPNMVRDFHEEREKGTEALVTHGSVVRAVLDFVCIAKGGRGRVVVCDSPQNDADWDGLWAAFHFDELLAFYREAAPELDLEIYDVRKEAVRKHHGVPIERYSRPGDPLGYAPIELGSDSEFADVPERAGRLYGAEYDISETEGHHSQGHHEYLVARSFLEADVIVNVPKWKTHKKSGITVWIKSAIGICGDKNWLPHHTEGTPSQGGDQFADSGVKQRLERRVVAATKRALSGGGPVRLRLGSLLRRGGAHVFGDTNRGTVRSGNWHGNDTIWRTVLDLHKCWIYADRDGVLRDTPQRRFLCVVDGIVTGEGNGPLAPTARHDGIVLAGLDPVTVDTTAAVLMGFDPDRLKILTRAPLARGYRVASRTRDQMQCDSNVPSWDGPLLELTDPLDWAPHFGWVGYIERARDPDEVGTAATAA